jgi:hypothetical protein
MIPLITAICAAGTALVGVGLIVARAARGVTQEVAGLRLEVAGLRQEMTEQRGADRIEVRELIEAKLSVHSDLCPALRGHSKR